MGETRVPPWHMWGDTQIVEMKSTTTNAQRQTTQIARIRYARPETWRWLWGVDLLDGTFAESTQTSTLQVIMQVTTGIGRTQMTIELGRFTFFWAGVGVPVWDPFTNRFGKKWANNNNCPPASDSAPSVVQNMNSFVGQDIQVNVVSLFTSIGDGGGISGNIVRCAVTALFAPNVHVRPEWHVRDGDTAQFAGGEHRGSVL